MHTLVRSLVIAFTTSVVVGAFAVPQAQADDAIGNTQISNAVVNSGNVVKVGSSGAAYVPATMTVSDPEGILSAGGTLYHGASPVDNDRSVQLGSCTWQFFPDSDTCSVGGTLDGLQHSHAGVWKMSARAYGQPWDHRRVDTAATFNVLRSSKLFGSVSPKPVKGQQATLTGWLTRANWETHTDEPHAGRQVLLQFCLGTCNTGRTLTTDSNGRFQTTVSTSTSGYWRVSTPATADTAAPLPWVSGYVW